MSAIAAISTDGYVGAELTYGTVNGEMFADFVRGTLIPDMEPYAGDNAGILLYYLPPCSPDFNPIEYAFSSVKSYLKDHDELLQTVSDPLPNIKSIFINCLKL